MQYSINTLRTLFRDTTSKGPYHTVPPTGMSRPVFPTIVPDDCYRRLLPTVTVHSLNVNPNLDRTPAPNDFNCFSNTAVHLASSPP